MKLIQFAMASFSCSRLHTAHTRCTSLQCRTLTTVDSSKKLQIRLNKLMGQLEMCSRREADTLIGNGKVTVDGICATLGQMVDPSSKIEIIKDNGGPPLITIALNKPRSFISQAVNARPNQRFAWELLTWENQVKVCNYGRRGIPAEYRKEPSSLKKLGCCGRLDLDSSGLLLFTQDGRIAKKILGADSHVEKHYEILVRPFSEGAPPFEFLANQLRHGLWLDGEKLLPAQVSYSRQRGGKTYKVSLTLQQGKYRQIRRMCDLVGLEVLRLMRVGIGGLHIEDLDLEKVGQWHVLSQDHINLLLGNESLEI